LISGTVEYISPQDSAAGLALQFFLVKRFKLYSFQLQDLPQTVTMLL
jgi:hypothetical protein